VSALVERIIAVESNGDPNARNSRSTAMGLGQFLDETWLDLVRVYRPDLVRGRNARETLDLRREPKLAREIVPRALVVISGHWEEKVVTIQNNPAPPLLYDYYGFPESTYQITFPAPGAPEIATRISELLKASGIECTYDHARGFDHGVFIPLKVAFPKADVPIVQVSLLASMDPAKHIRLGQALAPLRDEGVLIIGSGMSYHNMRTLMSHMRGTNGRAPNAGSQRFDDWLEQVLTRMRPNERVPGLTHWDTAPAARDAHPREEHLLPLHVAVGAAGNDPGRRMLKDVVMGAVESAFQFG
jgi:aromatic ring-opening dioxygenase catalytic subunit (LigB family)